MKMKKSIGRYEIRGELGGGGMAVVHRAYDPLFERDVAIKVLSDKLKDDPHFRQRFEREAKTVAGLEHPAIVPVYDIVKEHNQLYLVMRLMKGGSLKDRLKSSGPLPLAEVSLILTRLADALDKVHEKGIIHRDIKPHNILFDEGGQQLKKAYLADFGIARSIVPGEVTEAGSYPYTAPEQREKKGLDGRTDVYQLGVVLFEMLTGHWLRSGRFASVRHSNPDLPPECDQVIARALAHKKEERYSTAGDLASAFVEAASRAVVKGVPTIPLQPLAAANNQKRITISHAGSEDLPTIPRQPRAKGPHDTGPVTKSVVRGSEQPNILPDAKEMNQMPAPKSKMGWLLAGTLASVALIAALVYLLIGSSLPAKGPLLALMIGFEPKVDVKRVDESLQDAEIGLKLYQNDTVIAYEEASAVILIYCGEDTLLMGLEASENMQVDCQQALKQEQNLIGRLDSQLLPSARGIDPSQTRRSVRAARSDEEQVPHLLNPRNSLITNTRPTLHWEEVAGATGYRLALDFPNDDDWQVETSKTSWPYPVDKPPLPAGSTVFVKLTTLDNPNLIDETFLDVADDATLAEVSAAEAQIGQLAIDETAELYLLAQLYRQKGMYAAAISQLEQIAAKQDAISADLWQQLGDLYFEIDLLAQAETDYQSALEAAQTNDNQHAAANAYVALALTADAFEEQAQAVEYLNEAEELYEQIGQTEQAAHVVELRDEIAQ